MGWLQIFMVKSSCFSGAKLRNDLFIKDFVDVLVFSAHSGIIALFWMPLLVADDALIWNRCFQLVKQKISFRPKIAITLFYFESIILRIRKQRQVESSSGLHLSWFVLSPRQLARQVANLYVRDKSCPCLEHTTQQQASAPSIKSLGFNKVSDTCWNCYILLCLLQSGNLTANGESHPVKNACSV